MSEANIIPRHQWTNGGEEVFILRWINRDGTTCAKRLKDGEAIDSVPFKNPLVVGQTVTAEDWDPRPVCGGGIHGWPWAFSLGEGKDCNWSAIWQVYGVLPADIVEIENKVKFRTGTLLYSGDWHGAMMFVLDGQMAWVRHASSVAATASGYNGAATASGDNGAATASGSRGAATASGFRGAATASGDNGAATASGYNGAATASGESGAATASGDNGAATASGDSGAATASGSSGAATASGYSGAATASGSRGAATASGDEGAATASGSRGAATASGYSGAATASGEALSAVVTGLDGRARAPEFGCIALAWWNGKKGRSEMRSALIGKGQGKLKPDTWYMLDAGGHFKEVKE